MQKIFGLLFVAVGLFGMVVYPAMGRVLSRDDKIAMLLGLFI